MFSLIFVSHYKNKNFDQRDLSLDRTETKPTSNQYASIEVKRDSRKDSEKKKDFAFCLYFLFHIPLLQREILCPNYTLLHPGHLEVKRISGLAYTKSLSKAIYHPCST